MDTAQALEAHVIQYRQSWDWGYERTKRVSEFTRWDARVGMLHVGARDEGRRWTWWVALARPDFGQSLLRPFVVKSALATGRSAKLRGAKLSIRNCCKRVACKIMEGL